MPPATTARLPRGRTANATHAATAASPTRTASATSTLRVKRSNAAPTSDKATTAAVTAKQICAIGTRPTASGYAEQDEGEREADDACGKRPQRLLRPAGEGLAGDRERRAVRQLDGPRHAGDPPAHEPNRCREPTLRMAEQAGEGGSEDRLHPDRLGDGEIGGENGEDSPRKREPGVTVEAAVEQLEVVRDRDERADGHKHQQPRGCPQRHRNPDGGGGDERGDSEGHERGVADARP